ncbi:MAG: cysteine desulfurase [Lachnospiraceae bacterium]|nr:cysteine desulfurase [Lachnospiraceae bacterium]
MEVYLDNSATTKCFPEAAELMKKVMCEDYGNPSSMHRKGIQAENYLRYAKNIIAHNLKVNEKELIFTSGGTEANNLALVGCAFANARAGRHLITTAIEHPAVGQTMNYLEQEGFRVTYLPVGKNGVINLSDLEQAINHDTILVSIMHTNNETGSLQPVIEAGLLIKKLNPQLIFHVDAVQGFCKYQIYPKRMNIDLLTVSGHKIHGPKGVGLLYADEKVKINPISFGGNQQRGLRSGTINVPGITGMAKAIEMQYPNMAGDIDKLYELKYYFSDALKRIPEVIINSPLDGNGAPHIVNASFIGIKSEVLLHALEEENIYVSAGSACSAGKTNHQSATLKAIGLNKEAIESAIRFSFSHYTTMAELNYTLQTMYDKIPMLRKYVRK